MRSFHDGAENNAQQHEDDEQNDGHDEHERSLGAELAFILAAPLQCHPGGKFNLTRDALLDIFDEPAEVAAPDVALHEHAKQAVFARDLAGPACAPDRSDLPQWHAKALLGWNQDAADPFDILPFVARQAELNRVARASFDRRY